MSIATAIMAAQGKVANAYTAVSTKGGTLPATQNLSNLPTAISSIPSGGGVGIPREVSQTGVYQIPNSFTFSLPDNATDVANYVLYYAFRSYSGSTPGLTSVDLSSLTTVSGVRAFLYAFYGCNNLTSVDLSSLTTVSGESSFQEAFDNCKSLTSVSFPALTNISGRSGFDGTFYGCTNLTSISFPVLTTVGYRGLYRFARGCTSLTSVSFPALTTLSGGSGLSGAFMGCTSLTTISFPVLTDLTTNSSSSLNSTFSGCTSLTSVSFPALTTNSFSSLYRDYFNGMMSSTGSTVTHTIHFPSNMQSTISGLTGYPNFGGTSGYVTLAFDLPATS